MYSVGLDKFIDRIADSLSIRCANSGGFDRG